MSFLAHGERDTLKQICSYTSQNCSEVPYDPFGLCLGMSHQSWLQSRIHKITSPGPQISYFGLNR